MGQLHSVESFHSNFSVSSTLCCILDRLESRIAVVVNQMTSDIIEKESSRKREPATVADIILQVDMQTVDDLQGLSTP